MILKYFIFTFFSGLVLMASSSLIKDFLENREQSSVSEEIEHAYVEPVKSSSSKEVKTIGTLIHEKLEESPLPKSDSVIYKMNNGILLGVTPGQLISEHPNLLMPDDYENCEGESKIFHLVSRVNDTLGRFYEGYETWDVPYISRIYVKSPKVINEENVQVGMSFKQLQQLIKIESIIVSEMDCNTYVSSDLYSYRLDHCPESSKLTPKDIPLETPLTEFSYLKRQKVKLFPGRIKNESGFSILTTGNFEEQYLGKNFESKKWWGLYDNAKTTKLEEAKVSFNKKEFEGFDFIEVSAKPTKDLKYLISGPNLRASDLKTINTEEEHLGVYYDIDFEFNKVYYSLIVKADSNSMGYSNYTLHIASKDQKQLLFASPYFDDETPPKPWIGDIDRDGKPDFIYSTSHKYSVTQKTLCLSSEAKNGELCKMVSQIHSTAM